MKTAEFDYRLPPGLIAQHPIEPRDASRLLVLGRSGGSIEHRRFRDLPHCLRPGDVLVANDSRVIAARLYGRKQDTGGRIELLLVARRDVSDAGAVDEGEQLWEVLVKPGRRLREGACIELDGAAPHVPSTGGQLVGASALLESPGLRGEIVGRTAYGGRLVRFVGDKVGTYLERSGSAPLPPYIRAPLADPERYQTVYARVRGSAAAPTAGLHFTQQLLDGLAGLGIACAFVTLHIGLDTFRPVQAEEVSAHEMHSEFAELTEATASALNEVHARGGRIVAVGTTAVRVLESAASSRGTLAPYRDWTKLFIYPGYRFRAVDALITNFHLPRSSLLMLVSALAGRENVMRAYHEAAARAYRFYSFGDAMLIV